MGEPETSDQIAAFLNTWQNELPSLHQNRLLNGNDLARFAETKGIQVGRAEPLQVYERGWLAADDWDSDRSPRFHPFRIYPLHRVLQVCSPRRAATSTLDRGKLGPFLSRIVTSLPELDAIGHLASEQRCRPADPAGACPVAISYRPHVLSWLRAGEGPSAAARRV